MARLHLSLAPSKLKETAQRVLRALTVLVVLAALYRYCWLDATDPFKCRALLDHGRWLDPTGGSYLGQGQPLQNWQPPGCLLHGYRARSIKGCLASRRMVFIGDSTIRQVFWATAKKLNPEKVQAEKGRLLQRHSDARFHDAGVTIDFLWDPFLNSTGLHAELAAYQTGMAQRRTNGAEARTSASLILIGGGLWYARYVALNPLKQFKDAIDEIVRHMTAGSEPAPAVTGPRALSKVVGSSDFLLLAPIQRPWYASLSPSRAATITPEKVNAMNDYLEQLSVYQDVDVIWSWSLMTWNQKAAYEAGGMHVVDSVAAKKADILLNLRCNAETAAKDHQRYPFNKTCCSNYRPPGWVPNLLLMVALVGLPGYYLLRMADWRSVRKRPSLVGLRQVLVLGRGRPATLADRRLHALAIFLNALCYCFYADRTQVFNKLQKQYASDEFTALCAVVGALGLLSLRRSSRAPAPAAASASADPSFLSRDQTDEWKGWMQFVILIYHYTGASKVLGIYEGVRLLVASYLFLTGFGHTVFFLQKRDYSFARLAAVLVRLNLLSCALPYMMRTDYLFYYFAPLVSFWFAVVYLTMRIRPSGNEHLSFLLGKMLCSAALATALIKLPGPLEVLFALLRYTCGIEWSVKEWRFRVSLDLYIVYVGMVCGMLFVRLTASPSASASAAASDPLSRLVAYVQRQQPRSFRRATILLSLLILATFFPLAHRAARSKAAYNARLQPYASGLPIVAYVVLRNLPHRQMRNVHSSVFAWLGRCSLETFVLQFHIWLAGDTKGRLSLGVWDADGGGDGGGAGWRQWAEFGLLTAVFLWVSHCVAAATVVLTQWIVHGGGGGGDGGGGGGGGGGGAVAELALRRHATADDAAPQPASDDAIPGSARIRSSLRDRDRGRLHRRLRRLASGALHAWTTDVRVRIASLLLLMWLLNMVRGTYLPMRIEGRAVTPADVRAMSGC
ncbi:MAG: hypothetical protein M1826_005926 [Phylliscum demangeonii]|nr:MAG: hypothetical protein M1826_005926 [Phylliscum demangeonii]